MMNYFDSLGDSFNADLAAITVADLNLSKIKEIREKINIKKDRREKFYKESEVKLYENRLE